MRRSPITQYRRSAAMSWCIAGRSRIPLRRRNGWRSNSIPKAPAPKSPCSMSIFPMKHCAPAAKRAGPDAWKAWRRSPKQPNWAADCGPQDYRPSRNPSASARISGAGLVSASRALIRDMFNGCMCPQASTNILSFGSSRCSFETIRSSRHGAIT